MVTSFFIDDEHDESFIKFGSYDPLGVHPNARFEMFKTAGVKDWSMYTYKPSVGGVFNKRDVTNFLDFNPAYPFLYISSINIAEIAKMLIDAG